MKLYLTLLALCCFRLISVSAAETAKPNILLIQADDLGCHGGEIKTPNLDALAAGGLRHVTSQPADPLSVGDHAPPHPLKGTVTNVGINQP